MRVSLTACNWGGRCGAVAKGSLCPFYTNQPRELRICGSIAPHTNELCQHAALQALWRSTNLTCHGVSRRRACHARAGTPVGCGACVARPPTQHPYGASTPYTRLVQCPVTARRSAAACRLHAGCRARRDMHARGACCSALPLSPACCSRPTCCTRRWHSRASASQCVALVTSAAGLPVAFTATSSEPMAAPTAASAVSGDSPSSAVTRASLASSAWSSAAAPAPPGSARCCARRPNSAAATSRCTAASLARATPLTASSVAPHSCCSQGSSASADCTLRAAGHAHARAVQQSVTQPRVL